MSSYFSSGILTITVSSGPMGRPSCARMSGCTGCPVARANPRRELATAYAFRPGDPMIAGIDTALQQSDGGAGAVIGRGPRDALGFGIGGANTRC